MVAGLRYRVKRAARQIGEQHRHMEQLLAQLGAALERGERGESRHLLNRYRGALDAHFALEDSTHFPALHGSNPSLLPVLERLVEDHVRFRAELDAIAEFVAGASIDAAVGRLSTLAVRLGRHEEEEEAIFPGGGVAPA